MPSFKLGRFSQPGLLREIDPENLWCLLAGYEKELAVLGFTLPAPEAAATLDYEKLTDLLMESDEFPPGLWDAFYFVHEMATAEGMDCLLDAVSQSSTVTIGKNNPTPGDMAIQVWLKDRELLERKHAEQFLEKARSFRSFCTSVTPIPPPHAATPEVTARMKNDLDDFFEKRKRGRHTKVFPYVRDDCVMFLVRRGDPFERRGSINNKGESVGVYYWPEKFDVLVLKPEAGELRINARNKGERAEYRKVFGRHLYGNDNFFGVESKYTLEPLRTVGRDSLAPINGMLGVRLIEVWFFWGGTCHEVEIREADDIFEAYRARGLAFPEKPEIVKARFNVLFPGSEKPRAVTITPPNEAQFMRDGDSVLIEKWMEQRGFIVKTEEPPTKHEPKHEHYVPADEKVLVSP